MKQISSDECGQTINHIHNQSLFTYYMYVYCVYLLCIYKYTHIQFIFRKYLHVHSQKKRYKRCHWGGTFSKGTLLYLLVSNMCTLSANMYQNGPFRFKHVPFEKVPPQWQLLHLYFWECTCKYFLYCVYTFISVYFILYINIFNI